MKGRRPTGVWRSLSVLGISSSISVFFFAVSGPGLPIINYIPPPCSYRWRRWSTTVKEEILTRDSHHSNNSPLHPLIWIVCFHWHIMAHSMDFPKIFLYWFHLDVMLTSESAVNQTRSKEDNSAVQHSVHKQGSNVRRQWQAQTTNIEQVMVNDDPRKWSKGRKV